MYLYLQYQLLLAMIKKGTKLYSILKLKCPHCHEGEFFEGKKHGHGTEFTRDGVLAC